MGQRNASHHPGKPSAASQGNQDQQKDMRNPHHQINQPTGQRVSDASGGCRKKPDHKRGNRADSGSQCAKPQAHRKPCQRACKHIPPHPVGTERIGHAGRKIFAGKVGDHRLSGKQTARDRHCEQCYNRTEHQQECPLPPVEMSAHRRAPPFRTRGSTTP